MPEKSNHGFGAGLDMEFAINVVQMAAIGWGSYPLPADFDDRTKL
jgi:hypothetical protein